MAGTAAQRFLRFRDRPLVAPSAVVDQRERVGRRESRGYAAFHSSSVSAAFVLVAGHPVVVLVGDEQPLALADALLSRALASRAYSSLRRHSPRLP